MTPVAISEGGLGASQKVSCYSDADPAIYVSKFGFLANRTINVNFSIFGYLEDAQ